MTLNHFSPLLCMMCRSSACYEELPVCRKCLNKFHRILSAKCINCGRTPHDCDCYNQGNIRFLFFYEGFRAKKLMFFIKSNVDRVAMDFIAELLVENCGINLDTFDAVTFVPRRRSVARRYGHDQAKELAKAISRVYNVPFVKTMNRVGGGE